MFLKTLFAAAAATLVVTSAHATPGTTTYAEDVSERSSAIAEQTGVRVIGEMGSLTVHGDEAATAVTVRATRKVWAPSAAQAATALSALDYSTRTIGQVLEIGPANTSDIERSTRTAIDLELTVPAGFAVHTTAGDERVSIDGVGSVAVDTRSGDVTVSNASQPVEVTTENGSVHLSHVLAATVRAGNGRVQIYRASMAVDVTTDNGSVELLEVSSATVHTETGDVRIQSAPVATDVTTRYGRVALRDVGPSIVRTADGAVDVTGATALVTVTTRDGDVQLSGVDSGLIRTEDGRVYVEGTNGPLDVATTNGSVSAHLLGQIEGTHINTTNGNVVLTVPEQVDATFKVGSRQGHVTIGDIPFSCTSQRRSGFYATAGNGDTPVEVLSREGNISVTTAGGPVTRGDLKRRDGTSG